MRAIDRRCTRRTTEWIGDITGNLNGALLEARIHCVQGNTRERRKGCTAALNSFAIVCKERCPQSLSHTRTAVIGRTAADTDDEMAAPGIQGCQDKPRVALIGGNERKPGTGCHFNGGRAPIAQQPKERGDGCAQRTGNSLLNDLASRGIDQRLYCALATIRDGHDGDSGFWKD